MSVEISSRAAQRKLKLLEIEKEQRLEEAEALKMTEDQRQTLFRSFTSVKVEFSDLDGLTWHVPRPHAPSRTMPPAPVHTNSHPRAPSSAPPLPPGLAFVVLTNADLASFSPEDTIRVSAASSRSHPRSTHPSSPHTLRRPSPSAPYSSPHSTSALPHGSPQSASSMYGTYVPRRRRSPVKGLFTTSPAADDSDSDRTVCPDEESAFRRSRRKSRSSRKLRGVGAEEKEERSDRMLEDGAGLSDEDIYGLGDVGSITSRHSTAAALNMGVPPPVRAPTSAPAYITYK